MLRVGKGRIADDGVGKTTVVEIHVAGDYRVRLEPVGKGGAGTQSSGVIDLGAVRVDPEPVDLSEASVSIERGRGIIVTIREVDRRARWTGHF